jgi:beta-glucosidase
VENIIANEYSARWTSNFITSKTEKVAFELKGDDKVKLFIDGKKRIETDLKNGYYTFDTEAGKTYKIVIEYVQSNDNAEVKFDVGFIEKATPETIASRVQSADVIVFVGGISAKLEGEAMPVSVEGFKGGDRTNIALPLVQTELLKALKATGKPVIFVNMSGGAMGFEWEAANLPAIMQAWYAGQAGGEAIADVLFGDYNPAGRLPVTFYKNVNDLPDFEDYSMKNRTYRYYTGESLYAFGHGLSYSKFTYSNLKIKRLQSGLVVVNVKVTNSGNLNGEEVSQLYLSNKKSSENTPIRTLKGFERVFLQAGRSKNLTFRLTEKDLSNITENGKSVPMLGNVEISVGGSQPFKQAILEKMVIQIDYKLK